MVFKNDFLDSSFLIALLIKNDTYHIKAHKLKQLFENERIMINNTVLTEVMNSLKINKNKKNYILEMDFIFDFLINDIEFSYLTKKDYIESKKLFKEYNQAINYSDCTIIKTMQNNKVNQIISFDTDFDKIKSIKRIHL